MVLLELKNINKNYELNFGMFKKRNEKNVLKNISLKVNQNETLGIVGESGSGKSTLSRIMLGLESPDSGDVIFEGKEMKNLNKIQLSQVRKDISAVFQDCYNSVNPRFAVEDIIKEPLRNFKKLNCDEEKKYIYNLLDIVGLRKEEINKYPHQLSGGQIQRVCIARAIALNPKLIIMDEAVSALDISIQAQILNLLKDLKKEFELSYVFISHDIEVVNYLCDNILFMKDGQTVEFVRSIHDVKHEYSKKLLHSVLPTHPRYRKCFNSADEINKVMTC